METGSVFLFVLLITMMDLQMSDANKPSEISQAIFCEGCAATVKEIKKKVDKKTGESREVRVVDAMDDICNLQNFASYEYSPPKTGQACKYIIEHYDEDIENIFVTNSKDFEKKICYELTKACEGVDRSKKEKEKLEVSINDRKQTVGQGSPGGSKKNTGPEEIRVNVNEEGAAEKLVSAINRSLKDNKNNNEIKEDEDDKDSDSEENIENLTDKDNNDKTEL